MNHYLQKTERLGQNILSTEVAWSRIETPLGPMIACATDRGICQLEFISDDLLVSPQQVLKEKFKGDVFQKENDHIMQVKQELADYFDAKKVRFDVPLHLIGTDFQLSVWQGLQQIPFGACITYSEQAVAMGNIKAVRAVAAANGRNKIAIVIPCHRVIGAGGKLTGYAGGIERKRWLLDFEMRISGTLLIQPHFHYNLFNK